MVDRNEKVCGMIEVGRQLRVECVFVKEERQSNEEYVQSNLAQSRIGT